MCTSCGHRRASAKPPSRRCANVLAVGEQALERDRLRDRAIVEEQVDRAARRQLARYGGADRSAVASATRVAGGRHAFAWCGARTVNGCPRGERLERSRSTAVSGSHMPSGRAAEAVLEVADAPAHLRRA